MQGERQRGNRGRKQETWGNKINNSWGAWRRSEEPPVPVRGKIVFYRQDYSDISYWGGGGAERHMKKGGGTSGEKGREIKEGWTRNRLTPVRRPVSDLFVVSEGLGSVGGTRSFSARFTYDFHPGSLVEHRSRILVKPASAVVRSVRSSTPQTTSRVIRVQQGGHHTVSDASENKSRGVVIADAPDDRVLTLKFTIKYQPKIIQMKITKLFDYFATLLHLLAMEKKIEEIQSGIQTINIQKCPEVEHIHDCIETRPTLNGCDSIDVEIFRKYKMAFKEFKFLIKSSLKIFRKYKMAFKEFKFLIKSTLKIFRKYKMAFKEFKFLSCVILQKFKRESKKNNHQSLELGEGTSPVSDDKQIIFSKTDELLLECGSNILGSSVENGLKNEKNHENSNIVNLNSSPQTKSSQSLKLDGVLNWEHQLKWIQWNKKRTPIVTQNSNGPCPLIAIANVLLLCRKITLPSVMEFITANQLLEYVADSIFENIPKCLYIEGIMYGKNRTLYCENGGNLNVCYYLFRFYAYDNYSSGAEIRNKNLKDLSGVSQLNYEQNVYDAIAILPHLHTGLDVNVKFTG
uniref:Ubiquitin carboxyl-terminal hydrolase n=1 Tax=Timema shepardi TaxID=629360 RepID=A0A7R9AYW9_TIMSH|nr:unnamed protein product [Timema shepardi]